MAQARRGGSPILALVAGVVVILAAVLGWVVWTGRYPSPDPSRMGVDLKLPTPPTLPTPSPMPDPQPAPLPVPGPKPG